MPPKLTPEERRKRNRDACRRWYANLTQDEKDRRANTMAAQAKQRKNQRSDETWKLRSSEASKPRSHAERILEACTMSDGRVYLSANPAKPACRDITRHNRTWGIFLASIDGKITAFTRGCVAMLFATGKLPAYCDYIDGDLMNTDPVNLVAVNYNIHDTELFPFPWVKRIPHNTVDTYEALGFLRGSTSPISLGTFPLAVDAAIAVASFHLKQGYSNSLYMTAPDLKPFYNAAMKQ